MTRSSSTSRFSKRLAAETRCEVRFDPGSLGLYATDASLYQIMPVGVVLPRTLPDLDAAVRIAAEEGVPVIPRGGATSLSGQTIGEALILDCSKYLNRIGIVDRAAMTVKVQPGVVLDRLNAHLKPLGLMFGPDVSTSDRATIGGMIGNNSAGARSLKYGKTADHVVGLDVVLNDGAMAHFGPESPESAAARPGRAGAIARAVRETVARHERAIREHFPRILRRVSGYNLDEFIPGLPVRPDGWPEEPWAFNLAKLVVGSEGTLAVAAEATLKVVPLPKAEGLVVLSFATIPAALERLREMIATGPASVEMIDKAILDLAAKNPEYARHLTFAEGDPAAVLAAQFHAGSREELETRVRDLASRFEGRPGVLGVKTTLDGTSGADFWKVRKAGLSLLMGMVGDAKPVAFVEDTAVDPDALPAFYDRFEGIIRRHGTYGSCYGHADVGCLHIRPVLNTKDPRDVDKLRSIAREVSDLVLEFGGAMSGEHGDGLARSAWNRKLFGEEVYEAFLDVKRAFDPKNRMNPGKVVAEPDPGADLRLGPAYHAAEPFETAFDFSGQGGFARAVEMCSGVGACRKEGGGTMCPSYMVTRDEEHSTRGRANLLRMVMNGSLPATGLDNRALSDALDLCLSCKACKTECPSNVDMAKLKAEWLHQHYQRHAVPLGSRLMGGLHRAYPLGAAVAPLANWVARQAPARWLLEKVAGVDRRRVLPAFAREDFRSWFRGHTPAAKPARGEVILLDDCFTTYNQPEIGIAAVRVLEAAGYSVKLAGLPCCGRPAASKGLLAEARKLAATNVDRLAGAARSGTPILGLEPSCLLMLVDEYRDFRLGPIADRIARQALLIDEFLADRSRIPDLPLRPRPEKIGLHGHCQQKALRGTTATVAALKRIPDLEVEALDSGCCGMAGSFGYERGHYDVSVALANRVLLPAVRRLEGKVAAPGFSCRSQVHALDGRWLPHPIQVIADQLFDP